ncbi:MAG: hemolysin family protein [Bacteriovoracaceae bacterium]
MTISNEFILLIFCFVSSAFFSGAEACLLAIPIDRINQLKDEDKKKAKYFNFLLKYSSDLLTTILVGNTFVNIAAAGITSNMAQRYFENEALAISTGITTFVVLIFGEILPKNFARAQAEKYILFSVKALRIVYFLLFPIIYIFTALLRGLLGEKIKVIGRIVTRDDIEYMVSKAEEESTIDSKQLNLLSSILEFPTIKVKDIMVPRNKVEVININSNVEEVVSFVKKHNYSRYPVVQNDLDSTIGFLHVKDLSFYAIEEKKNFKLKNIVKIPFFVYEHMKIQTVFDHMNRKKVHLALVKDENGLVVGIITLEDILEEIFGEIHDEHDDEQIKELNEGLYSNLSSKDSFTLNADYTLRDLDADYQIDIPPSDNYSTLNGFLLSLLGDSFPKKGQIIIWEGFSFELLDVAETTINLVKIKKLNIVAPTLNRE